LRALGTKNDARYNLKIVDVGGPRPPRQTSDDSDSAASDEPQTADEPAALDQAADDAAPVDEDLGSSDVEDEAEPEVVKEDEPSDVVSRTRAELADLDDLDV
jgi:hypothetical protein